MKKIYINESVYECINIECTNCCGIEELYNLTNNADTIIAYVADESVRRSFIIFHDAVNYKRGENLAKVIRSKRFGKLSATKQVYNPNSGNKIMMWTWFPNWSKIDKYRERIKFSYQE